MKNLFVGLVTSIILLFNVSSKISAQFGEEASHVTLKAVQIKDSVYAGEKVSFTVTVNIEDGWHINSNKPKEEFLIPSVLVSGNKNYEIISIKYPEAKDLKFDFSETPVSVYEGEFIITGKIKIPSEVKAGKIKLPLILKYQACNNSTCLAPTEVSDEIVLNISNKSTAVELKGEKKIDSKIEDKIETEKQSQTNNTVPKEENEFESRGLLLSLLFVFIGGLALNLTPCVYPLIPITVGYFGGQSEGSTGKLFALGVTYVLGMAITYSIIGVITALSGAVFGALLQNTFVLIGIALVLITLSLSMFGVYEFKLPDALVARAGDAKGGVFGALFMGLTMGIVAAPCIGPFVLGLVTYVGAKADPYFGFMMFFTLAVGLGFPYIFLALFSGKIKSLPRAGFWMDAVKHIFGFILLGMAIYFITPILPKEIAGYILPVFAILAALYILIFDKAANQVKGFRIFKTVFSIIIIAVAIYLLIPEEKKSPDWKYYSEEVYSVSYKSSPIIIDFYADWCIPCKELDAYTFSHSEVINETKRFVNYKVDMTKTLTDETEKIRKKFNIKGMPTVLLIDSNGNEVERITGFVNADEFLGKIKNIQ